MATRFVPLTATPRCCSRQPVRLGARRPPGALHPRCRGGTGPALGQGQHLRHQQRAIPPAILLGLLIYNYATGTFSRSRIEQSTYESKYSAVSYQRDGERIAQLEREVQQVLVKAEQADTTPLQDGLTIPAEITRRQERQAALAQARAEIEARAQARYAIQLAEHQAKLAERAAKKERGEQVGGKPPQAPSPEPDATGQYNFTDPESRIMNVGCGQHFEQSNNAQVAVEVDSRLIVDTRVS